MRLARTVVIAVTIVLGCAATTAAQPQSWDKQLPAVKRFVVLDAFAGAAVLDKETGLVWERYPGDTNKDGVVNGSDGVPWDTALKYCVQLEVATRRGWRLPTIAELNSLVDTSQYNPPLPFGHPFVVEPMGFWSATPLASDSYQAWVGSFVHGFAGPVYKINPLRAWCVRGGAGTDAQ